MPWERTELRSEIILSGFLLPILLFLPGIVVWLSRGRVGLPVAVLLSGAIGMLCCQIVSPRMLGLHLPRWKDVFSAVVWAVTLLLAVAAVTALWEKFLVHFRVPFSREQDAALLIRSFSGVDLVLFLCGMCVIVPLLEEILFRRLIYGFLLRSSYIAAMIITPLFFSLMHFFILGIPGLIILGAGFQLCFLRSKNLTAAVLTHMLVNSAAAVNAILQ